MPKNISTLYLGSETNKAPETSPSLINFILTFNSLSSSIIFLCLGLSSTQAVILEICLFLYSAKFEIFFLLSSLNRQHLFQF